MIIHKTPSFLIYFGDQQKQLSLDDIDQHVYTPALQSVLQKMHIDQAAFLHQVHGVKGKHVTDDFMQGKNLQLFYEDGDFLVTRQHGLGIGVTTADCLPIVLYDKVSHVVAIVHAGWKGSLGGIVQRCVKNMEDLFQTQPEKLQVFFGPAAKACCYEVQQDFYDAFMEQGADSLAFLKKKNKIYFDNAVFASFQLRNLGIPSENIYTKYNMCTICDTSFCSYRRDKDKAGRQVTIVALH